MHADLEAPPRRVLLEAFGVALVVFVAYAVTHPDAVATLGRLYDDVVYLSVGKSIADGTGYRSVHLVGAPVHVKFPPLLPTVYAIAWRVLGTVDAVAPAAMWLNSVVTAAAAGALWWLARRELRVDPIPSALFVIVPIVTNRTMFYFAGASSEPWMLLGWAVALILVRRLTRLRADRTSAIGTALALGLTLAATMLARTQGLAVILGVIVGAAASRVGWRALGVTIASAAIPLFVWRAWHGAMMARGPLSPLPDQSSYVAWLPTNLGDLTDFAAVMSRISVPLYWVNLGDLLIGWTSPKTLLLAAALLACGGVGLAMLVRPFPALVLSVLISVGVLITWPYVQDRFLTPLLPVLGLAGAYATQRAIDRTTRAIRFGAIGGLALAGSVFLLVNAKARWESLRGQSQSPYIVAMGGMVSWLQRNTQPHERVMVPWGGAIYLRANRRTSIPNPEEAMLGPSVFDAPRQFLATRILADSVDVVAIWDRAPGRAGPWIRGMGMRCPGLLTEVAPATQVPRGVHFFRVRRDLACLRRFTDAPARPVAKTTTPR